MKPLHMLTNGCTTSVQALETRVELIATSWNIGTFKADICSGEMGYIMDMVEIFLCDIFDFVFVFYITYGIGGAFVILNRF